MALLQKRKEPFLAAILSCGLAVLGFDKPQSLAYTEHLVRCGQDLTEHGCYALD
jgi:hypothetical protein